MQDATSQMALDDPYLPSSGRSRARSCSPQSFRAVARRLSGKQTVSESVHQVFRERQRPGPYT
eukprot:4542963-Karenia_brevis.AAC.1